MSISAAQMVARIKETLYELYGKQHRSLSQSERQIVMRDISELEKSLRYWEQVNARESGSRPSVMEVKLRE